MIVSGTKPHNRSCAISISVKHGWLLGLANEAVCAGHGKGFVAPGASHFNRAKHAGAEPLSVLVR